MFRHISLYLLVFLYLILFANGLWGCAGIEKPESIKKNIDPQDLKSLKRELRKYFKYFHSIIENMNPNQKIKVLPPGATETQKKSAEEPIEELFKDYGITFINFMFPKNLVEFEEATSRKLFLEFELTKRLAGLDFITIIESLETAYLLDFHYKRYHKGSPTHLNAKANLKDSNIIEKFKEYSELQVYFERAQLKEVDPLQSPYFEKYSHLVEELSTKGDVEITKDYDLLKDYYHSGKAKFYKDILHPIELFLLLKENIKITHKPLFDLIDVVSIENNPEEILKKALEYGYLHRLMNLAKGQDRLENFFEIKLELIRKELSKLRVDSEVVVPPIKPQETSLPPQVEHPISSPEGAGQVKPPEKPPQPGTGVVEQPKPESAGVTKPITVKPENVINDILREAIAFVAKIKFTHVPKEFIKVPPPIPFRGSQTLIKTSAKTQTTPLGPGTNKPQPAPNPNTNISKPKPPIVPPLPIRSFAPRKPRPRKNKQNSNKTSPWVIFFSIAAICLLLLGGLIFLLVLMNKNDPGANNLPVTVQTKTSGKV